MDTSQVIVTVGGALLLGFVLWFFFGPRAVTVAQQTVGGIQEIGVEVRGSYSPDRIEVDAGRPVRLTFSAANQTHVPHRSSFRTSGSSAICRWARPYRSSLPQKSLVISSFTVV